MSSNPIVSRQTFSKGSRKLARKSFPVFFSNLVLKTMKDLNSSCKKKEMLWLIILYIRWKMEWLQCKHTLRNISFKSGPGFTQDATASQKNIKSYNRVYVSHHNKKNIHNREAYSYIILHLIVTLPGQLHQGWDQSCYRYLGRQSPSPRCLECYAMMCTWKVKILISCIQKIKFLWPNKYKLPDIVTTSNHPLYSHPFI